MFCDLRAKIAQMGKSPNAQSMVQGAVRRNGSLAFRNRGLILISGLKVRAGAFKELCNLVDTCNPIGCVYDTPSEV